MPGPAPHWIMITPEYPPTIGGVSDYTHLLARELAARGDRVEIWAPAPKTGAYVADPGVECHALDGRFGGAALEQLDEALKRAPRDAIVLVQYVPSGFGARSMNLRFAMWLGRRKERRWLMIHEAAFPFARGLARHDVLAVANRAMLVAITAGAERIFTSTPASEPLLNRWDLGRHPVEWLPVPASVPNAANAGSVERIRSDLCTDGRTLVGHFGTYGPLVATPLARAIEVMQTHERKVRWLLLGRGSTEFARALPSGVDAVARPDLEPQAIADHLAALDFITLPFPDGISARRTSAMAALAAGTPVVTTEGPSTESIWRLTRAVALSGQSPGSVAAAALRLAGDATAARALGARGRALYEERFAIGRLADSLRRHV